MPRAPTRPRAMASRTLLALLDRLATADAPQTLTAHERALLARHRKTLAPSKRGSRSAEQTSRQSPKDTAPSVQARDLIARHQQLAMQSDAGLANALQAYLQSLEATRLTKAETLALAQAILPEAQRFRSGSEALAAIKARLMQRYRDAVRTAKLAGED